MKPEINDFNPTLKEIMVEMCERVGADPYKIRFTTDKQWYTRYKWTKKESEDFGKWLINYFYHNTKRQNDIFSGFNYYNKPKYVFGSPSTFPGLIKTKTI